MNIEDFLSPANAIVERRVLDKGQLLNELAERAAVSLRLSPALISEAILKREALGSTGMGDGVAIPHARFADLKKPFGILARLRKPIDFEAVDGRTVDIVFLLLAPIAPEGDQLNALACIARKLRDPAVTSDIRKAKDGVALYHAVAVGREVSAPNGASGASSS
jgi:PTS system nitrogen regulatory IIA component